ncbi:hypothetical protein QBC34DRAFT_402850 [Podospora aff. communis PSN243]|uniref:Uncharacterized protein n=1 Tax=Podospora aff. communis PSN243 TaxID=3040156 RepID=A0AAV9GRI1_9PEZI|nr:hypothetical protein QBC34DRAFT_402850 [Podospora aff. communis PSN243]
MAETDPSLKFDLETALYGPGTLLGWYLTLLCVLITWIFHPSKSFPKLSLSPDVVFYSLYACIAAVHMAVLAARFETEELNALAQYWGDDYGQSVEGRKAVLEKMDPVIREMVLGIDAPFKVGMMFLWVVVVSLVGVVLAADEEARPRRRRLLPWVLFLSGMLMFCCFCFLATRCGPRAVLYGVFVGSVALGVRTLGIALFGAIWGGCAYLLVSGVLFVFMAVFAGMVLVCDPATWKGLFSREHWEDLAARVTVMKCIGSVVAFFPLAVLGVLLAGLFAVTLAFLAFGIGFIIWILPWVLWGMLTEGWFNVELGVRMSAFDQILGLCTGVAAVLLTVKAVCGTKWKEIWGAVCSGIRATCGNGRRVLVADRGKPRWRSWLDKLPSGNKFTATSESLGYELADVDDDSDTGDEDDVEAGRVSSDVERVA